MHTNINIARAELMIGRQGYDIAELTDRQYSILEDEVRQHHYRVNSLERLLAGFDSSVKSMTDQVDDGFRWSTDFVARDAQRIADEVTMVRSTEQAVVNIARALGVL